MTIEMQLNLGIASQTVLVERSVPLVGGDGDGPAGVEPRCNRQEPRPDLNHQIAEALFAFRVGSKVGQRRHDLV